MQKIKMASIVAAAFIPWELWLKKRVVISSRVVVLIHLLIVVLVQHYFQILPGQR